jgi:uncharacterized protein (DUF2461 family)
MGNVIKFEHGTSVVLVSLDLKNRESTLRVQVEDHSVTLNAWEAEDLVVWLSRQKDTLYWLAHQEEEDELDEEEIYPY